MAVGGGLVLVCMLITQSYAYMCVHVHVHVRRYFIGIALESGCLEWALVLGVLLLDSGVVTSTLECMESGGTREGIVDLVFKTASGIEQLLVWANSDW